MDDFSVEGKGLVAETAARPPKQTDNKVSKTHNNRPLKLSPVPDPQQKQPSFKFFDGNDSKDNDMPEVDDL